MTDALPDGFTDSISGVLGGIGDALGDGGDSDSASTMNDLIGGGGGGGFAFPILENPSQVFGLLLGKPPFGLEHALHLTA